MADLGARDLGARPPYGPKFSQFHAVFHKIWQNHMLAPPLEGWRPLLRGILDQPLISCIVIVSWTNHKCDCEHLVQYNPLLND